MTTSPAPELTADSDSSWHFDLGNKLLLPIENHLEIRGLAEPISTQDTWSSSRTTFKCFSVPESHNNTNSSSKNRSVSASMQTFNISYKQNGKIQQLRVLGLFVGLGGILKICLVPFSSSSLKTTWNWGCRNSKSYFVAGNSEKRKEHVLTSLSLRNISKIYQPDPGVVTWIGQNS